MLLFNPEFGGLRRRTFSAPGMPAVPLPKRLYLQLDNSAKNNKNRFVMAFCSLLTARGIFKEVTMGFLVVGHTHEDIDAYFSYLSKLLKQKNTYVLADLGLHGLAEVSSVYSGACPGSS
jgi:hypothetical protein